MNRLEMLQLCCEQEPQDPFNWYALATEYRKYNLEEALLYYEKVRSEFPEYVANYYHLASAYTEKKEFDKARQVYEEGLSIIDKSKEPKLWQELYNAYQNFLFEND
jgi:tetratricopeptide (TPR) repeat protein